MIQTEIPCPWCGQPLIEINFNSGYYLRICDNGTCPKFRERQGIREKGLAEMVGAPEPEIKKKPSTPHILRKGYEPWLEAKKQNYRTLRNLGVPPKEAARKSSRKRTKEILAKGGLN